MARRQRLLPRGLDAAQVTLLLESCRRDSPVGRRDLAVLKLLVRLGLRAGEVSRLQLDDIDWRAGEIVVVGKGTAAGTAAAASRCWGGDRRLSARPPSRLQSGVVSVFAGAAGWALVRRRPRDRRQIGCPRAARAAGRASSAAHGATEMLRAGASPPDIGQVLRGRSQPVEGCERRSRPRRARNRAPPAAPAGRRLRLNSYRGRSARERRPPRRAPRSDARGPAWRAMATAPESPTAGRAGGAFHIQGSETPVRTLGRPLMSECEAADVYRIIATLSTPLTRHAPVDLGSLTDRLRVATRDQHARCEQAVDLRRWLGTIDGYARLLGVFLAFHDSVVPALGDVSTVAPFSLTRRLHGRAARCRADREVLGVPDMPKSHPTLIVELPGLARQLGAWYVIEGSALGGTVIAHHARRSLPAVGGRAELSLRRRLVLG